MKMNRFFSVCIVSVLASASVTLAAGKTYQVTGPVLEVTDTKAVVQKGSDKWEIEKSATTKMTGGEIKVGDKVTIEYTMAAATIDVKKSEAKKKK